MKLLSTAWYLSCYDKTTEQIAAEYKLPSFNADKWREIAGISPEGDMLGAYEVRPEHFEFVQQYLPESVDLAKYNCSIELLGHYEWNRSK